MKKELTNILNDDKQLESALCEAMHRVGEQRDGARINAMKQMSEDEFRQMLNKTATEKPVPRVNMFSRSMFVRAIAACACLVLVLVGINYIDMGQQNNPAGYASLFNTYYQGDKVNWNTFDAGDDKLNAKGHPSTAFMLENATKLMSRRDARGNHEGIRRLEYLLTLNYKKSLEHEIRWYLGLGYMRDGQVNKARLEFRRVISLKSPHTADAQQILQKLK